MNHVGPFLIHRSIDIQETVSTHSLRCFDHIKNVCSDNLLYLLSWAFLHISASLLETDGSANGLYRNR